MLESTDIVFSLSAPARAERGSEMPFYTDETVARQLYCATLSAASSTARVCAPCQTAGEAEMKIFGMLSRNCGRLADTLVMVA